MPNTPDFIRKDISELIEAEEYHVMADDVMVCCLTMINGIKAVGFVVFDGFDLDLAKSHAKFDAIEKIWNIFKENFSGFQKT